MRKYNWMVWMLVLATACKKEVKTGDGILDVRLPREPDILNPILSETSIAATIQNLIFLPLMDFDPETQAPVPVLCTSAAQVIQRDRMTGYKLSLKKEAVWDDGTPVTSTDVLFTLKALLNPHVASASKRAVIESIDSIEAGPDPREFTFWTDENYFLDEQSFTNNFILQESKYDSLHYLKDIPWSFLKYQGTDTASVMGKKALAFAQYFQQPALGREQVSGNGPYELVQWVSNQSIRLRKKTNWWGSAYESTAVNFKAHPNEIIFRIIPEESNALLGLQEGLLDLIPSDLSPAMFENMKADSTLKAKVEFMQGPPTRYVYLALNTRSPVLDQVNTRKALANLLDLELLKTSLFQGYAERINAPFQPAKSYYNNDLKNIDFNISAAKDLLKSDGWLDQDKNGVLEKKIGLTKKELKLRLYSTPGGLGQKVAMHLQENARQAGISIEVLLKPLPIILDQVHNHDYEMAALAEVQYPGPDDPYPSWHSASYTAGGQNITGFSNSMADSLIFEIRHSEAGDTRVDLYKQLQQLIYEAQPIILLFAPQNLMAVNKNWIGKPTSVRPGYFVNDFRLRNEK